MNKTTRFFSKPLSIIFFGVLFYSILAICGCDSTATKDDKEDQSKEEFTYQDKPLYNFEERRIGKKGQTGIFLGDTRVMIEKRTGLPAVYNEIITFIPKKDRGNSNDSTRFNFQNKIQQNNFKQASSEIDEDVEELRDRFQDELDEESIQDRCITTISAVETISICYGLIVRWKLDLAKCEEILTDEELIIVLNHLKDRVLDDVEVSGSFDYMYPELYGNCSIPNNIPSGTISEPSQEADAGVTVVAIIDSGWDFNYTNGSNARASIWWNSADAQRVMQTSDIDSFYKKMNLVDSTKFPFDDLGHGTAVTGVLMETLRGKIPKAKVQLLPIKTHGRDGYANIFDIACGICFAYDLGADVLNASWGMKFHTDSSIVYLEDIMNHVTHANSSIAYERTSPMKIVASGGNLRSGVSLSPREFYPTRLGYEIGMDNSNSGNDHIYPVTSIEENLTGSRFISSFSNYADTTYAGLGKQRVICPTYATLT